MKDGESLSIHELSKLLDCDIRIIKAQIEYLEYQGYIRKSSLACKSNIKKCFSCSACEFKNRQGVVWELVDSLVVRK